MLLGSSAEATDQGITGKKLLLKSSGKLVLLSNDERATEVAASRVKLPEREGMNMKDEQGDAARVAKIERLIAAGVLELADLAAWERADTAHFIRAYYAAQQEATDGDRRP